VRERLAEKVPERRVDDAEAQVDERELPEVEALAPPSPGKNGSSPSNASDSSTK
jgi:hypothetical protein